MHIGVIGAGYVGLVVATCFAKLGHQVSIVDSAAQKIAAINSGRSLLYEKGLDELLSSVVGVHLHAVTDLPQVVRGAEIVFICVQTPGGEGGALDTAYVEKAAREVGQALSTAAPRPTIVIKSTMPPGSTQGVVVPALEGASGKKAGEDFGVVFNPKFLREGTAVEDFLHPYRIVIGELEPNSGAPVVDLYQPFQCPLLRVNLTTAEVIKLIANSFLATKISFINEIGNICKLLGVDVYDVAEGIGLDPRISPHFLRAGPGFGGSCLPKDIQGLIASSKALGYEPELLHSVIKVNEDQPAMLLRLAEERFGSLAGVKVAVLGLAFKPGTDDVRNSPSLKVIQGLLERRSDITVYDPAVKATALGSLANAVTFAHDAAQAVQDAAIVFLLTE